MEYCKKWIKFCKNSGEESFIVRSNSTKYTVNRDKIKLKTKEEISWGSPIYHGRYVVRKCFADYKYLIDILSDKYQVRRNSN